MYHIFLKKANFSFVLREKIQLIKTLVIKHRLTKKIYYESIFFVFIEIEIHAIFHDTLVQDLWGSTPLHYAFINDLPENVDILLEAGADPTIRDKDNYLYNEEEIPSEPIKNMVDYL